MSTIKKYDEIDINQINYNKPERVGQSFFSSISYGETLKPLFIQTPKVKSITNIKDIVDKKTPYLEIDIPSNKLDLYDLQTECYELLQRILVTLKRENEALIIAERARTRAFVDLLYDRKTNSGKVHQNNNNYANSTKKHSIEPCSPSSVAEVVNLVADRV